MPDAEREAERKLCEAMRRSRYWKWQLSYLAARRDSLIAQYFSTPVQAAATLGALAEIKRLMNAPAIVAKYLAAVEAPADETDTAEDDTPHATDDLIDG